MEKVKIISFHHAHGPQASKLVEEEVNQFLANELPKIGGKLRDIKLTSSATTTMHLVTAMIIYTIEEA